MESYKLEHELFIYSDIHRFMYGRKKDISKRVKNYLEFVTCLTIPLDGIDIDSSKIKNEETLKKITTAGEYEGEAIFINIIGENNTSVYKVIQNIYLVELYKLKER